MNFPELLARGGPESAARVRSEPTPGSARYRHIAAILRKGKAFVELIDGAIIDKPLSFPHAALGGFLAFGVGRWDETVGGSRYAAMGAAGSIRFGKHTVLMPEASFTHWSLLPGGCYPNTLCLGVSPEIVIEVPKDTNTDDELSRKRDIYFAAGVAQVWVAELWPRTVTVFRASGSTEVFAEADTLTGGDMLPGFALPLAKLFEKLPVEPKKKGKTAKPKKKKQ